MQKQGNGKSVVHNKPEHDDVLCSDGNFTDFIHESLSYLQNCPDSQKQINLSQSHRVYLSEENLIECLNIEKENQRVKVCLLE